MKPGYLTTEFWLTVIVGFLTNLGTIEVPDKFKWIVNLALVLGYAISRGLAKYETADAAGVFTVTPVDPVATEEAEQQAVVAAAKPKPRSTRKKAS